ncbi:MAG: hypothetical protein HDR12_06015 [Lachnospiraceae bacterium]|nr:hypothetical protein [Lachnospiraceae bacterium]
MALSNEDLLAISRLLDTKFDAKLQPIENQMKRMENRMEKIENQVIRIENRVTGIENQVISIENRVTGIENQVISIENQVTSIENRVTRIEVDLLENNVIPRLNTIESCYTDTYNRYKDNADKMDGAYADIGLLKKVVSEHSEKLQKIS